MKILVTGARGFIGRNLVYSLQNSGVHEVFQYDIESSVSDLDKFTKDCEFVFHLAGVNRSPNEDAFMKGNFGFTDSLLNSLKKHHNNCGVMIASSIQAELNNPYGQSKRAGEQLLIKYSEETKSKIYIYRFPNVFGKWSLPNYNSVIATFSYNVARNLPIVINDKKTILKLVYIDDVINELFSAINGLENREGNFCFVSPIYTVSLGRIVKLLREFHLSRIFLTIPNMKNDFTRKLYSTYISFLPESDLTYPLKMNIDERGSFSEFIKTANSGQVSINVTKPGIVKGNHWHHSKCEKFLVVSGEAVVKLRHRERKEVIEYYVNGNNLKVLDIPPGYTHNIMNIGSTDLVTIMWANELYNPNNPDTYFLEV